MTSASRERESALRVALFSGNYNCTRDGANQALNRLVAHLEQKGVVVRVYSPTCETPAFPPKGTLISVPSISLPRRREYRLAGPMSARQKRDLTAFAPDLIHISAPDILGVSAFFFARKLGIPTVASVHTRFETYFRFYGLGHLEHLAQSYLKWLYSNCQQVLVPSGCMAEILHQQGVESDIRFWRRGVDHSQFRPDRRDMAWRQSIGIADTDVVVAFVGRVVLEKGLADFSRAIAGLRERGAEFRVLVVGDGPARPWFQNALPEAIFTGALSGTDLARAFASADIFLNPSTTETFGNVNLEAMASGVPAICARASGNSSLITHAVTGLLVEPQNHESYVRALEQLVLDGDLRKSMGIAGVTASQQYKWYDILDAVLQHYHTAVAAFQRTPVQQGRLYSATPEDIRNHPGASK